MQKTGKKDPLVCEHCGAKTAITLPYGPHYFCERHFTKFFEDRFRKTIRKYKLFRPKERILIALSGGKDSCVLLHLLSKYYSKSNYLEALIIDEGVKGYRENAIKLAEENCKERKIKYTIIEFKKEFGIKDGMFLIGNIGRLSPEKGQIDLILAAKEVCDKREDVIFVL
jgi:glycosyltransferase involved in cell wall biosynthesis